MYAAQATEVQQLGAARVATRCYQGAASDASSDAQRQGSERSGACQDPTGSVMHQDHKSGSAAKVGMQPASDHQQSKAVMEAATYGLAQGLRITVCK